MPFKIKLTINVFIEDGLFTLQDLNHRISSFNYGFFDPPKNRLIAFQPSAPRNLQDPSRQTSQPSEMLSLLLTIDRADLLEETFDHWEVFLLLVDLYKIVKHIS